jgi:hypothetical protein
LLLLYDICPDDDHIEAHGFIYSFIGSMLAPQNDRPIVIASKRQIATDTSTAGSRINAQNQRTSIIYKGDVSVVGFGFKMYHPNLQAVISFVAIVFFF